MLRFIGRYFKNMWGTFTKALNNIMDGVEQKDPAKKDEGINGLIGFILFRLFLWGIPGIYFAIRGQLDGYVEFIILVYSVGFFLAWGVDDEAQPVKPTPPQPMADIDGIRARAKKQYPAMQQTAFILLTDLCRYFPGLIVPSSPTAVMASVNVEITPKKVAKYPFVIGKGSCIRPRSEIQEAMSQIVSQHLNAYDLPLNIDTTYQAQDGSEWPGLIVDHVYDLGNQYRVDLVITDEAEVAALTAENDSQSDGDTPAAPHDPDFD